MKAKMMRHALAAAALTAVLAACGGSGGDGGGAATLPSGHVLGGAFGAIESAANVGDPADCGGTYVAKLVLGFFSYPGVCQVVTNACNQKASATGVLVVVERMGGVAQPAISPGSYALGTTAEGGGQLLAYAIAARTDVTCTPVASYTATGGTVTIGAVEADRVTGSVEIAFPGGGQLSGAFEAPRCGRTYDTCNGDACTGSTTCIP